MNRRSDLPHDDGLLAHVDPIDGDRLRSIWSASAASTALLQEITASAAREHLPAAPVTSPTPAADAPVVALHPRRRDTGTRGTGTRGTGTRGTRTRRLGWTAAAAVVALAAVAVGGLLPGASAPAYAVNQRPDGVIQIDWYRDLRGGDEIARELRAYGLDVSVATVPSSPSGVGRLLVASVDGFEPDGSYPPGVHWGADGADDVFTWTIDPDVFTGSITVELAVAAEPGEAYRYAEEVFEPGEPLGGLHCTLGTPLRASDVAAHADGLDLRWFVASLPDSADPTLLGEVEVEAVPDGEVLWGYAVDDTTVRLTVRPDGTDLGPVHVPRLSDLPCGS